MCERGTFHTKAIKLDGELESMFPAVDPVIATGGAHSAASGSSSTAPSALLGSSTSPVVLHDSSILLHLFLPFTQPIVIRAIIENGVLGTSLLRTTKEGDISKPGQFWSLINLNVLYFKKSCAVILILFEHKTSKCLKKTIFLQQ